MHTKTLRETLNRSQGRLSRASKRSPCQPGNAPGARPHPRLPWRAAQARHPAPRVVGSCVVSVGASGGAAQPAVPSLPGQGRLRRRYAMAHAPPWDLRASTAPPGSVAGRPEACCPPQRAAPPETPVTSNDKTPTAYPQVTPPTANELTIMKAPPTETSVAPPGRERARRPDVGEIRSDRRCVVLHDVRSGM